MAAMYRASTSCGTSKRARYFETRPWTVEQWCTHPIKPELFESGLRARGKRGKTRASRRDGALARRANFDRDESPLSMMIPSVKAPRGLA